MHGLLTNKNRRIPTKKKFGDPLYPLHYHIFGGSRGVFSKVVLGFRNFGYDFWGLGEMFEGEFADTCGKTNLLVLIDGEADPSSEHI